MSDDDREIDIESDVSLYLVFYLCNVVINNVFYAVDIASNRTFFWLDSVLFVQEDDSDSRSHPRQNANSQYFSQVSQNIIWIFCWTILFNYLVFIKVRKSAQI